VELWQQVGDGTYLGVVPSTRFPIYTRGNAGEVFPEVQYPLSFTMSWDLSTRAFADSVISTGIVSRQELEHEPAALVGCFAGYTYLNLSATRTVAMRVPGSKIEDVDRQYMGASDAPPHRRQKGDRSVRAALAGIRYGLTTLRLKDLPQQRIDAERVASWSRSLPDRERASDADLLKTLRAVQPLVAELFRNHLIVSSQAGVPVALLRAMCEKKLKDASVLPSLLGGAGNVASAAPSDLLWHLGRMVHDSAILTGIFDPGTEGLAERLRVAADAHDADTVAYNQAFAAFLDEHGCRGPNEWETACPTWGTDPNLAYVLVDRMRAAAPDHSPEIRHANLVADRERALAAADTKLSKLSRKRMRDLVGSASMFAQGREQAKTTVIRAIHEMRLFSIELAKRCSARSGGKPDDLWFVTADELDAYVADPTPFAAVIAERRAMRDRLSQLEPPFIINGSVPPVETWKRRDAVSTATVSVGQKFTGIAGCPGVARGRARVVLDPADPRDIGPGDVLVAPLTDPSWTPLFVPVEAVVVDVGAMLSHAVIVSRELGIPSVVSITGATRMIPDGALIEVDGNHGTVTILELPAR
jgi:rifampicin phosphotransferase